VRPKITGFVAGALFAGAAVLIWIVLRSVIGGAFFSSFFAPLVILVVLELIWAAFALRKIFGGPVEHGPHTDTPDEGRG